LGAPSFRVIHDRLLRAYFGENRDITATSTLRVVWREAGLPESEFERSEDPALLEETLEQHRGAVARGVTGVPASGVAGSDVYVMGAHPVELYRHWIRRLQAGVLEREG
jgi:predicted DsbA family dithiol-disulfide isomerase